MEGPGEHVVMRIGFAERWLRRARTQCADGNLQAGLLTLTLADAEVRYALESSGWPAARARAPRRLWPWLLAAAAVAVAVWTFGLRTPAAVPVSASSTDGPPVIRLTYRVGSLLALVTVPVVQSAPTAAVRPAVHPAARRGPATVRTAPISTTAIAPARPAASTAAVSSGTTAVTGTTGSTSSSQLAVPAAPVTSPVISDVDLIEMVLAADRTLRGTSP